ncbi:MAG: hybrid sensor histidine kinase/response regulator [Arcobacteraceae bacterium]|nr:hybrid sensor histidine kinase/response regulator [Arcobacteraceae bacterium]
MENNKHSILVVDDTTTNIDILLDLLKGYDVVVAMDGKSALDILEEDDNIDLILLDIMMPVLDGFEVCKTIKKNKKTRDIPVIFLTAKSDDDSIKIAFEVGGIDYLTKPFRPIELTSKIKTHLELVTHQKQVIENNRHIVLEELINNIAHQWRQPLSIISTQASSILLQKELGMISDEEVAVGCNSILKSCDFLSDTIDNFKKILVYDLKKEQFNLYDAINDNLSLLQYSTDDTSSQLLINTPRDIHINGSKNELIQVLLHIVDNAKGIECQDDKKLIFLDVVQKDKKVTITIKDNGGGIDDAIIDKIFDPYFTTKHKYVGTGLGLYIVYNIIKNSFLGTIKVTNTIFEYEGKKYKGANFEIQIPLN